MKSLHRIAGSHLARLAMAAAALSALAACGGGGDGGSSPPQSGTPPPMADSGMIPLSVYDSVDSFIDYLAAWRQSNTTEPLAVTGTPPVSDTTEPVTIPGP